MSQANLRSFLLSPPLDPTIIRHILTTLVTPRVDTQSPQAPPFLPAGALWGSRLDPVEAPHAELGLLCIFS